MPPVEATELVSYLVLQTSFVTAQQFIRAHKSLESYNHFVCGWVKEVRTWWILCDNRKGEFKKFAVETLSIDSKQQVPLGDRYLLRVKLLSKFYT